MFGQRVVRAFAASAAAAAAIGFGAAAHAQNPEMTIGVSVPTLDNPFWVRAVDFAEHVADELNIELAVVGAQNNEQKQYNDLQSLVSRGVDALVVTPQSTASAPGLIRLANQNDLPIMVVDRDPGFPPENDRAPYIGFIGPDDVTAGRDIAEFLIDQGATKIAGLGGLPGSSVAEGRQEGLDQAIAAHDGVELVQYLGVGESEDDGYNAMQNLLAAHPSGGIDAVWCYNDALCLGAYRAIQQAGRGDEIILGGMDLVPQALELIEQGTNYRFSTGGHWLQLGFGVMIAYDTVKGHEPLERDIRLKLLGVTDDNFPAFKAQYIDSAPPFEVKEYTLTHNPNTDRQTFPLQIQ